MAAVAMSSTYTLYLSVPLSAGNVDPFLVECEFRDNPVQGVTIVHHINETMVIFMMMMMMMMIMMMTTTTTVVIVVVK